MSLTEQFETDGFIKLENLLGAREVETLQRIVGGQIDDETSSTSYDFHSLSNQVFSGSQSLSGGAAERFDLELYRQLIQSDESARPFVDQPNENDTLPDGKFFYDVAAWRHSRKMREIAFCSLIVPVVAQLLQTKTLQFWEDTTFVKEPGAATRTCFHSDYGYFQISGDQCAIVWVPLDKTDEETGTLECIRGSHKWGRTFKPNVFFTQTTIPGSVGEKLPDIEKDPSAYDIVPIYANPGDVVVMNVRTIHGAGGNISQDKQRRAISLRYFGDDIRYDDKPGALPQPWLTHELQTGDKLDHADFPKVWPMTKSPAALMQEYDTYLSQAGDQSKAA